jgi:Zn-dependent metalloprotease
MPKGGFMSKRVAEPMTPGSGRSLYSGWVSLATKRNEDGTYTLEDPATGARTLDAQSGLAPPTAFVDANNIWGEPAEGYGPRVAIDAQYGLIQTLGMYRDILGRNSIDDQGFALTARVHIGNLRRAYWDVASKTLNLGNGDGVLFGPMVSLDTIGHEVSHGLIVDVRDWGDEGEEGALHEAFADAFGVGVEWYASQSNPNVHFDYSIGEDQYTPGRPGDAIRYLDAPRRAQGIDHLSHYTPTTPIHVAATLPGNAFFLLTAGGQNPTSRLGVEGGIGIEKGLKIWYQALLAMDGEATFVKARQATIAAAEALYGVGSEEAQKTAQAWTAVGVSA